MYFKCLFFTFIVLLFSIYVIVNRRSSEIKGTINFYHSLSIISVQKFISKLFLSKRTKLKKKSQTFFFSQSPLFYLYRCQWACKARVEYYNSPRLRSKILLLLFQGPLKSEDPEDWALTLVLIAIGAIMPWKTWRGTFNENVAPGRPFSVLIVPSNRPSSRTCRSTPWCTPESWVVVVKEEIFTWLTEKTENFLSKLPMSQFCK